MVPFQYAYQGLRPAVLQSFNRVCYAEFVNEKVPRLMHLNELWNNLGNS